MRKSLISLLFVLPLGAADLEFKEAFADPATRQAALSKLVPQTRDWFFYHALHQQLSGQADAYRKTIEAWKAASSTEILIPTDGLEILENRELLLRFDAEPRKSSDALIRQLDLKFEDTKPDARADEKLPDRLDPALISAQAFENIANARNSGEGYKKYSEARLLAELDRLATFDETKLRFFHRSLSRADHPGIVPLIVKNLQLSGPDKFGERKIHQLLTRGQMDELLAAVPSLRNDEAFAVRYLTTLLPGAETDFDRDTAAHAAHLAACRTFVLGLPPALNSLKAHVLFHHLRLQRELGQFPQEDLLTFLRLPRSVDSLYRLLPPAAENPVIQLSEDFRKATGCPPVYDDRPLVQVYLRHLLGTMESSDPFKEFIEEAPLRQIHARARLLAGADPNRWGAVLHPAEVQELQKETRISFAPGQQELLGGDAAVKLTLDLKNTPELAVRVFELDLPGWIEREESEPSVGLDLEGLVPHFERSLRFDQAPLLLHREVLDLPELTGPGAWIVECVSRGVVSRALIRKGRLIPFIEPAARGQIIRVFDEKGNLLTDASVSIGTETFAAKEEGGIFVPDKGRSARNTGIVRHGKLAVPLELRPRFDEVSLDARFHVDREQLLADQEASLSLRLRLNSHGHEIPLEWIEKPSIVMEATLVNGTKTERVISSELKLEPAMSIPFQVPANARGLRLKFTGTVTPHDGEDPVPVTAEKSYQLNGILGSSRIAAGLFTKSTEGYRLEVRGRNGEPLPSRPVSLEFLHRDYEESLQLEVRTDDSGKVELGSLPDIEVVEAKGTGIDSASLQPGNEESWHKRPSHLNLALGEEARLPLTRPMENPDRTRVSLVETRDDVVVRDHFDKLASQDGLLVVRGLPAGDYSLTMDGSNIPVRVSGGQLRQQLLVSTSRIVPHHLPAMPSIHSAALAEGSLVLHVNGAAPGTRVALVGRRYLYHWPMGNALQPFANPEPDSIVPDFIGNDLLEARKLSDELRYILDRRAAKSYPGSLLPRPGLLVNRWSQEDLVQDKQAGAGGLDGNVLPRLSEGESQPAPESSDDDDSNREDLWESVDFLAKGSVVRSDLQVAEDGTLRLPATDFVHCQYLEVIVLDHHARHHSILPLAPNDPPLRDRRLSRPLDPGKYHVGTRRAAALAKGAEASIESVIDADWRAFTTLAEAHAFLAGASGDPNLERFRPLIDWPSLDEAAKLAFLSEHACHELHLFLARKDKEFFDKHVKPMLAEKKAPDLIDDVLLQRDLNKYLRPYAWQRLNAAEKALLSQALPAARQRITSELENRWEIESPTPEQETILFTKTLGGSELSVADSLGLASASPEFNAPEEGGTTGATYLIKKLDAIIIPEIDFEDISVAEAIDHLRAKSIEQDTIEIDPAKRGINFAIRKPRPSLVGEAQGIDPGTLRVKELKLRNVPLGKVLKYLVDGTKLRYKVDDFAVTFVPATETDEDLFTKTFLVPPDFISSLGGSLRDPQDDPFSDPFADSPSGRMPEILAPRKNEIEVLQSNGVKFPEGATARFDAATSTLVVRNTPTNLDLIEQITEQISGGHSGALEAMDAFSGSEGSIANSIGKPIDLSVTDMVTGSLRSDGSATNRNYIDAVLNNPQPGAPAFAGPVAGNFPARPSWSSDRDKTRLWRESRYYHYIGSTGEAFIPLNRFWLDLAAWDGNGSFVSPHFNACTSNANEALLCLAMLDLPFKAERPETTVDGSTLRVKAREPMLLFYKDTRETQKLAQDSPVLVRQTFHRFDDQFRTENGRKIENSITGDFTPGIPYEASMIVTNPSGAGRRIDVLAQIPAGAIPLSAKSSTESLTKDLEPYGVLTLKLAFYFPLPGEFPIYPMQVSEGDLVLARGESKTLRAPAEAAPIDANSWPAIARDASPEVVLERLKTINLKTADLKLIRWRMRELDFYQKSVAILRERLHFSREVYAYAFFHADAGSLGDALENTPLTDDLGEWLDSTLLKIRPEEHRHWETIEFDPLVNPRTHRFADKDRLTHPDALRHFESFLDILAWKPVLTAEDQLSLTAQLLLQDRVDEALTRFDAFNPADLTSRMAYDYLQAVVLFHRSQAVEARAIALEYGALPPGLWKERFGKVIAQADEILALQVPRKADEEKPQEEAPSIDLALAADGKLLVKQHKLGKTSLQLFSVDLEVLFSKDPFLTGEGALQPGIRANETREVALAAAETTVELPENFRKGNVLVTASSGTTNMLKVLDSRALEMIRQPEERTLQVYDTASRLPLSQCYVKVYVQGMNGETRFHKDGYTDLRGKFDYLSHTGEKLGEIRRISVLISHPEKGARIEVFDL
ncbi:hypothetical protein [Luteolibacter luteus]|uniref:Uncharacterized protein n=1 Tax=Luteolibacter luteus TaxID=2728835 RepID=A0A858RD45_9BACT|nr:hypothetical protein [Luteolibacter luteus]QJE94652.1 hypothetical protein HHL09_02260 [Luteolibacter luteus]